MVIGKTTMLLSSHPVYLLLAKRNFVHCVSELECVYFIYYPKVFVLFAVNIHFVQSELLSNTAWRDNTIKTFP